MRIRIKTCCISSAEEAKLAIALGADALGLVGKMPSGPGSISDAEISSIAKTIHPPIASFLLTCEQTADGIIQHVKRANTNTVQLVDELIDGNYSEIRLALPQLNIVQVIHVNGEDSIEKALSVQDHVDAILLDSGEPKAKIKTLGGTGNTHDWTISRKLVSEVRIPVFLAGGLHAGNVKEAIEIVQPFAVDVCSGVRTDGKLDPVKLGEFIKAVYSI